MLIAVLLFVAACVRVLPVRNEPGGRPDERCPGVSGTRRCLSGIGASDPVFVSSPSRVLHIQLVFKA